MEGIGELGILDETQEVARCVTFPRTFPDGVLMIEQAVVPQVHAMHNGAPGLLISVGARALLPTEDMAHDFGCRVAQIGNDERAQKLDRPLIRLEETTHYRGYFSLYLRDLIEVDFGNWGIRVVHWPEKGLSEHCNLEIFPLDANIRKSALRKRSEITEFAVEIAAKLKTPKDHTCPCDLDIADRLSHYNLISMAD